MKMHFSFEVYQNTGVHVISFLISINIILRPW